MKTLYISLAFLLIPYLANEFTISNQNKFTNIPQCSPITENNADDCLRLNHIQLLGTHNSYKLLPHPDLTERLNEELEGWANDIAYEHKPLQEQLQELGIRQFELDVYADTSGGLFSKPSGAVLVGDDSYIQADEMMEPGFKTIHIPDVDYRSSCLTFKTCLNEIQNWSVLNPNHLPIMIMVEAKDGERKNWPPITFAKPIKFNSSLMHDIDKEILEIFEPANLITPDNVRRDYETLNQAIQNEGWPTLAESRGKIMFALDNTGEHKSMYLSGNPNLEGRVMFVSSKPDESTAGFIKMNDSIDQQKEIKTYVSQGYIVRTRTDLPTQEARSGNTKRRDLAFKSGAQFLSTDYPEVSPFGSGYVVKLTDNDRIARCNPITSPRDCKNRFLNE